MAAGNENEMAVGEGFQCLFRRIRVRSFRVVVIGNAGNSTDPFKSMFHAAELFQDRANRFNGHTHHIRQQRCGKAILNIVFAEKMQIRFRTDKNIFIL